MMNLVERKPLRVLVVEDNPNMQILLRYVLRPWYDMEMAFSYQEALQAAEKETFDILLVDIHLGRGHTGVDFLQRLRHRPEYRDTPAIAFTAYASIGDRKRLLRQGFDAYVGKPFTRTDLMRVLEEVAAPPAPQVDAIPRLRADRPTLRPVKLSASEADTFRPTLA